MPEKYTKEQFWQLYKKLPEELQEAIFSVETADSIYDICERNGIEEIPKVAKLVGRVLLGVLPPDEFQEILKRELKLNRDQAKKVSREINRFIFFPVKNSLEELYKIEIAPPAKPKITPPPEAAPPEEKPDVYREPIE